MKSLGRVMYPTTMIRLRRAVTSVIAASIVLPTLIVPSSAMAEEAPRTSVTVADDIPLAADTMNRTVTEGWEAPIRVVLTPLHQRRRVRLRTERQPW